MNAFKIEKEKYRSPNQQREQWIFTKKERSRTKLDSAQIGCTKNSRALKKPRKSFLPAFGLLESFFLGL